MVEADAVVDSPATYADPDGIAGMQHDFHPQHMNLYLPPLRPTMKIAVRLVVESMLVPYVLMVSLLHTRGLVTALWPPSPGPGWCWRCAGSRPAGCPAP